VTAAINPRVVIADAAVIQLERSDVMGSFSIAYRSVRHAS
jgi:hypothetical protein